MQANLGFLYYTDIYQMKDNAITSNATKIKELLDTKFEPYLPYGFTEAINKDYIILDTTYPGLLIGAGLAHGVKNDDDDFKIGFSFDHTTGLPIIQGASVKGVIRSTFPNYDKHKNTDTAIKDVKAGWILKLIEHINDADFLYTYYEPQASISTEEKEKITALESEIFEGKQGNTYLSTYHRDIFYDAIIYGANHDDFFLGADYITPHIDSLKNPKPIKFLKILPNVCFMFQFDLTDGLLLKKEQKETLFKKILMTMGIGAKTNVGYGQFKESNT
jgi:CRISPR-associated protein Cmr6